MDEVEKSEYAKKGKEFAEEMSKTVNKTAETISRQGEQIQQSAIYRSVSEASRHHHYDVKLILLLL